MSPCTVCGRPGERVHGGAACSVECATLLFVRPKDETPDERALSSWRWRQRRAETRGEPFTEPCPYDEAERALIVRMSMLRRSQPAVAADIERRAGVTCEQLWPSHPLFREEKSMRSEPEMRRT